MSHYEEQYRGAYEKAVLGACPEWAKRESRRVRVALAEGAIAKRELADLKTTLRRLKNATR